MCRAVSYQRPSFNSASACSSRVPFLNKLSNERDTRDRNPLRLLRTRVLKMGHLPATFPPAKACEPRSVEAISHEM